MHNKNNNKTHSFFQGLRPFSSSIPKTLKKHLRKGGYNYSSIVDNWTRIVNKKISDVCYPVTIKMGKEMKNGTLILNVIHGKEVEVEYKKNQIIEEINSFFGFDCITSIKLKISQNKIEKERINLQKIKNLGEIEKKMSNLNNDQLKNSLNNLVKAFYEKNK